MVPRNLVWSSLRDLFGGGSTRRRRCRGKRPATSFCAQFDGGDGPIGRRAAAPLGGYEALEVRMMFAAPQGDFGFDDATGTITSYTGTGGDVEIPATINGKAVTSIGNYAFYGCSGLTSLAIPAGVTSIGYSVFSGCRGLTSLAIPAGVTTIDYFAFDGCSGLTSITLPAGVTSIGLSAFRDCSGLTSITIPAGVTSIGNGAFDGCSGLKSLVLPEGITSIGYYAFNGCSGLTSITIPAGVTSIGNSAFQECGLKSLSLIHI